MLPRITGLALCHMRSWLPSFPYHLSLSGNRQHHAGIAIDGEQARPHRAKVDSTGPNQSRSNCMCQVIVKEPSYTPGLRMALTEQYLALIWSSSHRRPVKA